MNAVFKSLVILTGYIFFRPYVLVREHSRMSGRQLATWATSAIARGNTDKETRVRNHSWIFSGAGTRKRLIWNMGILACSVRYPALFWLPAADQFALLCGQAELWQNQTRGSCSFQAITRVKPASLSPTFTLTWERIWVRDPHGFSLLLAGRQNSLSEEREITEKADHDPIMLVIQYNWPQVYVLESSRD